MPRAAFTSRRWPAEGLRWVAVPPLRQIYPFGFWYSQCYCKMHSFAHNILRLLLFAVFSCSGLSLQHNNTGRKAFATIVLPVEDKDERSYALQSVMWVQSLQEMGVNSADIFILIAHTSSFDHFFRTLGARILYFDVLTAPKAGKGTKSLLSKLWLWNVTDYEQIVYMDSDIQLLRSPAALLHLCQADLCAAPDTFMRADESYFNAGLLVLKPSAVSFDFLRAHAHLADSAFCEQDMLNAVYKGKWQALDKSFNYMHSSIRSAPPGTVGVHAKYWEDMADGTVQERVSKAERHVAAASPLSHDAPHQSSFAHDVASLDRFIASRKLWHAGHVNLVPAQMRRYRDLMAETVAHVSTKDAPTVNVCETGFNAGHSALLFLSVSPHIRYYGFDLGEVEASRPSHAFIKRSHKARHVEVMWGDAAETVPAFSERIAQPLCHLLSIDGHHSYQGVLSDLENFRTILMPDAVVLVDDCTHRNEIYEAAVTRLAFEEKKYNFVESVAYQPNGLPPSLRSASSEGFCLLRFAGP